MSADIREVCNQKSGISIHPTCLSPNDSFKKEESKDMERGRWAEGDGGLSKRSEGGK